MESIDREIERRSNRGKRLAKLLRDIPKGMSYEKFLRHPDVEALELDFITSSQMYEAYRQESTK